MKKRKRENGKWKKSREEHWSIPFVQEKEGVMQANDDEFKSVIQTSDGGYALTGYTKSYTEPTYGDLWAFKLNATELVMYLPLSSYNKHVCSPFVSCL